MIVIIRGAGDIATGIALRLFRSNLKIIMLDIAKPTSIRRTVCFSEAIRCGNYEIEGIKGELAKNESHAMQIVNSNKIAVIVDPEGKSIEKIKPDILVDAILAKRNLGTKINDAPVVIGVGPGFEAGVDCNAVVETMRGHYLGRTIYKGKAIPNTNIPGLIGGYSGERVLRSPCKGKFKTLKNIGDMVKEGETIATVEGKPVVSTIDGVLRGLLADGTEVFEGMKSGDVDPRAKKEYCYSASDKALAVAGGVLEAILQLAMCN